MKGKVRHEVTEKSHSVYCRCYNFPRTNLKNAKREVVFSSRSSKDLLSDKLYPTPNLGHNLSLSKFTDYRLLKIFKSYVWPPLMKSFRDWSFLVRTRVTSGGRWPLYCASFCLNYKLRFPGKKYLLFRFFWSRFYLKFSNETLNKYKCNYLWFGVFILVLFDLIFFYYLQIWSHFFTCCNFKSIGFFKIQIFIMWYFFNLSFYWPDTVHPLLNNNIFEFPWSYLIYHEGF